MAIDPADDCTIWYVGDYYRKGAENPSSRIGAFRMPPCGEPGIGEHRRGLHASEGKVRKVFTYPLHR